MAVPYIFATHAAGAVPASQLDDDFAYVLNNGSSVATLAALKTIATVAADCPLVVTMRGYLAAGDGGGGPRWQWNSTSTATANDFNIVAVTGIATGRYIRELSGQAVSPKWGGCGLGATDDTAQFQKIVDAGYPIDMSGCTVPIGVAGSGNAIVVGTNDAPAIFSDGSGTFTLAPVQIAADIDSVALSQTPGGAGDLTLTATPVTFSTGGQFITIKSTANLSALTFTVNGTNDAGAVIAEAKTGPNNTTVTTTLTFKTVTSVAVSGAAAGALTVGNSGHCTLINVTRNDFTFSGLFFNMPISTVPGTPPAGGNVVYLTNNARLRIINNRFVGGVNPIHIDIATPNTNDDVWIKNNLITGCYAVAITAGIVNKIEVTDNIIHDAVYNVATASGVIRFGGLTVVGLSQSVIFSRNIIIDCLVGLAQEAIDISTGAMQNVICDSNLIVNVGNGGFEIKTNSTVGVPSDIYYNWQFTNNYVVMSGGGGIYLNNGAGFDAPDGKAAHVTISGNTFTAAAPTASTTGIFVGGWDDVSITDNHIYNLELGIVINPDGNTSDVGNSIDVSNNRVNTSSYAIYLQGRNINDLTLQGNRCVSTGTYPLNTSAAVTTGLISKGNYWETQAAATPAAFIRNVNDAVFDGDTFVGTVGAVNISSLASTNTRFVRCDLHPGTGNGFDISVGSTDNIIEACTVQGLADAKVIISLTGGATITAFNNSRDAIAGDPTGTRAVGKVGEISWESAPTSGGAIYWVGTTTGVPSAAAWKKVAIA